MAFWRRIAGFVNGFEGDSSEDELVEDHDGEERDDKSNEADKIGKLTQTLA